jgi:hypothetical protein
VTAYKIFKFCSGLFIVAIVVLTFITLAIGI